MVDPTQVLLFGSFTEDETKCWLDHTLDNTEKSDKKKGFQSKPAKATPESTSGSCSRVSNVVSTRNGWGISHPNEPSEGNRHMGNKPCVDYCNYGNLSMSVNGKTLESDCCNGVNQASKDEIKFPALLELNNDCDTLRISNPTLLGFNGLNLNGSNNSFSVESHNMVTCWRKDGSVLTPQNILPCGLINSGNLCFLNATIQALLSCSPFILLVQRLRNRNVPEVGYPTLTAFREFISKFYVTGNVDIKKKDSLVLETGRSFSPIMFETVLKNFTPDVPSRISGRSRQEDAQEFLSFILHQMHDELLKLEGKFQSRGINSSLVSSSDDEEWEMVGRKNTSAVTRTQYFIPSELSKIFGGQLHSVVKAKGNKASATVQPFLLLHLDISHEATRTVEDALHLFSAPEMLEEYRASTMGKAGFISARKSVKMQSLPKIMVLHLMRFGYDSRRSIKLHKPVSFPLELQLSRDLLVSTTSEICRAGDMNLFPP